MSKTTWAILLVKGLFFALWILYGPLGLGPDEAQYWTWSQKLSFGYYSKPPGIAWQIFGTTFLLGSTELGVRAGALLLSLLLACAGYRLACAAQLSKEQANGAAWIFALTPIGLFSSFFAITDGGLLLFWTLGLTALLEGRLLLLGLYIGLGALFKWPIYLLWFPAAYCYRRAIFTPCVLSLVGLVPTIFWNIEHDFATFRHVFTAASGGDGGRTGGNVGEFLGAQIALVSPLFFWGICSCLLKSWKSPLKILATTSLWFIGATLLYASFSKTQGNWALFVYPALFILIASHYSMRWIARGAVVSLLLTLVVLAIPLAQPYSVLLWSVNPFRHNLGWDRLVPPSFDPTTQFLLADKYQITSELSFYNTHKEKAFFLNITGARNNQFTYWDGLEEKKGQEALFFVVEQAPYLEEKLEKIRKEYPERLAPYFASVEVPEYIPLVMAGVTPLKMAVCFRCHRYNGEKPLKTGRW